MPRATQPSFDFGGVPGADAGDDTLTVSELGRRINRALKAEFSSSVWVRGEIQGWSVKGPHAYFTLADDTPGRNAHMRVQFFAPVRQRLAGKLTEHDLRLADGVKVRINGVPDFYAPAGTVGFKLDDIDPHFTLGDLAAQRAMVLRRLQADGTLDANKRHPAPLLPLRLGIVTSEGSAAWHDFRHELEASGFGFQLVVADTIVQGPNAGRSVARAIRAVAAHATHAGLDAIVVMRGGGARNDLAAFDAEVVARAIGAAPVPVFTGIGHEIDRSIADDAAHTVLKTPTACAAHLVERVASAWQGADRRWGAIVEAAGRAVGAEQQRLDDLASRIAERTVHALAAADERLTVRRRTLVDAAPRCLTRAGDALSATSHRLSARVDADLRLAGQHLDAAADRLRRRPGQVLELGTAQLDSLEARVGALDPVNVMRRGWSITRRSDGRVVRTLDDVRIGDELVTQLQAGTVASTVTSKEPRT